LIYGATGHTGQLLAARAREIGLRVVLAARERSRLEAVAGTSGEKLIVVDLQDPDRLDDAVKQAKVVINAAGPFGDTVEPILRSCLRAGTHYLDVSGELHGFMTAASFDHEARRRGIMVMPGAGFGIIATDSLARMAADRSPDALYLRVGLTLPESFSRGSMRTIVSMVRDRVLIRRSGKLTTVPVGRLLHSFDYGEGERTSAAINWPDPLTASLWTGIRNIEAYAEANSVTRLLYSTGAALAPSPWDLLEPMAKAITDIVGERARSPADSGQAVVAETEDPWRRRRRLRLRTVGAYAFTQVAAIEIARRIVEDRFEPGFRTPSQVFGSDLIWSVDGSVVEED
jgi:short subunit dehydrogenase-like uncharacterized protein